MLTVAPEVGAATVSRVVTNGGGEGDMWRD
jgi:hypothetical protein